MEVLLLDEAEAVWGHHDPVGDELVLEDSDADGERDLLEAAAVHTLRNGGAVHTFSREDMPDAAPVAALLRH